MGDDGSCWKKIRRRSGITSKYYVSLILEMELDEQKKKKKKKKKKIKE